MTFFLKHCFDTWPHLAPLLNIPFRMHLCMRWCMIFKLYTPIPNDFQHWHIRFISIQFSVDLLSVLSFAFDKISGFCFKCQNRDDMAWHDMSMKISNQHLHLVDIISKQYLNTYLFYHIATHELMLVLIYRKHLKLKPILFDMVTYRCDWYCFEIDTVCTMRQRKRMFLLCGLQSNGGKLHFLINYYWNICRTRVLNSLKW